MTGKQSALQRPHLSTGERRHQRSQRIETRRNGPGGDLPAGRPFATSARGLWRDVGCKPLCPYNA